MSTKSDTSILDENSLSPGRKRCIKYSILILAAFVVCLCIFLLLASYFFGAQNSKTTEEETTIPWWEKGVIYQLDPHTFSNTNGTLAGVIQHLDYIKKIGASALLLTPVYVPSFTDFTDLIIDGEFTDIYPSLGTIDDFTSLVQEAHKKRLEVTLDLVLTHTSDSHPWFVGNENETDTNDYYVWVNGTEDNPPNKWNQVSGEDSAWKFNATRNQYYLHRMGEDKPALNYKSALLQEHIKKVIEFWLDQGVAGFRIVAADLLFIAPSLDVAEITEFEREDINILGEWRTLLSERTEHDGKPRLLAVDMSGFTSVPPVVFYGNEMEPASDFTVNYELADTSSSSTGFQIEDIIRMQMSSKSSWTLPNWAINSAWQYDKLETKRGEALNMMTLMLSGVTFTLAGDELCMTDDTDSPFRQLPWEDDGSISEDTGCVGSFRKVSEIRRNASIPRAEIGFSYPQVTKDWFSFIRHEESKRFLFAMNLGTDNRNLSMEGTGSIIAISFSSNSNPAEGKTTNLTNIVLGPYDATVVRLSES